MTNWYRKVYKIGKLPDNATIKITKTIKDLYMFKDMQLIGYDGEDTYISIPHISEYKGNCTDNMFYSYIQGDKITFVIESKHDLSEYEGILSVEYYKRGD